MQTQQHNIKLPEGTFTVNVISYDSSDDQDLKTIYSEWLSLSNKLKKLGSRGINIPEGLTEVAFCRAMNTVRFTQAITAKKGIKVNTSFDTFNLSTNSRIQVKACSILPDLTSFGPSSVWDELYFLDFYREGKWDGTFDIYLINNDFIYNHKVNLNQTMKQQQAQGRRPRFSIFKEIIKVNSLSPIKTYKI